MKDKEVLRAVLKDRKVTQAVFAEKMGYNGPNSVSMLIKEGNGKVMRTDTFIKALNILGYDVIVKDRFSGEEIAVLSE